MGYKNDFLGVWFSVCHCCCSVMCLEKLSVIVFGSATAAWLIDALGSRRELYLRPLIDTERGIRADLSPMINTVNIGARYHWA